MKKPATANGKYNSKANELKANSSSSSSSSSSGSSAASSPQKEKKEKKSPSSPKVDYEKLEKLEGIPRIHDKVAFQNLEISTNFTPEISQYKVT